MTTSKFIPRFLLVFALVLLGVVSAQAQFARTWVSGVGDDANPCTRTAPCKTFAGAISKTASGGEIDVLDPGSFGQVTITKSITIDGGGGLVAGILAQGTTNGIVVSGANVVVILRNLRINGANGTNSAGLNGVRFLAGKSLQVENCEIFGFSQNGIDVSLNQGTAASVLVKNTSLLNNTQNGIRTTNQNGAGPISVALDGVILDSNGAGIVAADNSKVRVSNSVASSNTNDGFMALFTAGAAEMDLDSCKSANNGSNGVEAQGASATIRMTNCTVVGNNVGLAASGGQIISFGNNSIAGNATNGSPTSTILRH
jgi:hypothetical protein